MKTAIAQFALALVLATSASARPLCSPSERFPSGNLIQEGDAEAEVIQEGPDRTVQLQTPEGGAAGYRYEFFLKQKTVQVYTKHGVVTQICRIYNF